ncbi:MAG: hypothetical protein H6984_12600 [Pseudomonadales bacterium]|nr:hypothetical protein [Halioglobus sp.]MCP5123289.1 hypothetical protein [Pseudomonadales bacterium]MCP5192939.1 hypothetical protein [Pseudomonadales bacterium]
MSRRNRSQRSARLPLPAPQPGAELDERILAYARANAPRRTVRRPGRWVAGLATAGVVAVAVMITLPQQTRSPLVQEREQGSSDAPAPAAMKISRQDMAQRRPAEQAAAGFVRAPAAPAATEPANAAENTTASGIGHSAERGADRDADGLADIAVAEADQAFSQPVLSEQALRTELDRIRAELQAGEQSRARADYQLLRRHCPGCELPQELEQALSLYPPAN